MLLLMNLLVSSLAVFVSAKIIPGVTIDTFGTSVVVAVVLGVINVIVKPILLVLTLPITVVTLGLFTLIVNATMILLVDSLVRGFAVDGLLAAILFSIALSLVTMVLYSFTN